MNRRGFFGSLLGLLALPFTAMAGKRAWRDLASNEVLDTGVYRFAYHGAILKGDYIWTERYIDDNGCMVVKHTITFLKGRHPAGEFPDVLEGFKRESSYYEEDVVSKRCCVCVVDRESPKG